jgi:integral membrane sensor domain MASE1
VVALCQVGSNALHVVLAALAVQLFIGAPPRFDSLRNMVAFIVVAGLATTALAGALEVSLYLLTGWATDFWLVWRQRVLADALGIITITPLIVLTCMGQLVIGSQHMPRRSYAELGLLTIGLLAAGIPVLGRESPRPGNVPALLLAPLPLLLWAAVRLGPSGLERFTSDRCGSGTGEWVSRARAFRHPVVGRECAFVPDLPDRDLDLPSCCWLPSSRNGVGRRNN